MQTKIGFIGLGIMGKPMAKNLIKAGYSLTVHNRSSGAVQELAASGANVAGSPGKVAGVSDVVITMLPDTPDVEHVVKGPDGVLSGAKPGLVLVDMSSIAPLKSRELAKIAAEKGVIMLEAPVSGGEPKAIEGTLSIMVGGPEEIFQKVHPILCAMGSSVTRVGEIGSGNIAKLCNQIIVGINIAAMSEAFVLAQKAGVDVEIVYQAIRGGLAGSTVLDAKAPLVFDRRFKPGFRIELHAKDLTNARVTAGELGVPTPLTDMVLDFMTDLKKEGRGGDDHCGLIQYFEKIAHTEVLPGKSSKG